MPSNQPPSDDLLDQAAELRAGGMSWEAVAAKLETCLVALENIKFDLVRLSAGGQTHQHITSLAMDAMSLRVDL